VGIGPNLDRSQGGADYVGFRPRKGGPSIWDGTVLGVKRSLQSLLTESVKALEPLIAIVEGLSGLVRTSKI